MSANALWLCILIIVTAAAFLLRRRYLSVREKRSPASAASPDQPPAAGAKPPLSVSLHKLAGDLSSFFDDSAQPTDLLANSDFVRGVALFTREEAPADLVLSYVTGDNSVISCMASAALRERQEAGDTPDRMFDAVGHSVVKLRRTRIGMLDDKGLPIGKWRRLADVEVKRLSQNRRR